MVIPSVERDLLKMVVCNRYEKAKPAVAFIRQFGFKRGAIASTVAHDSHNIIAVGTNDDEICRAVNLLVKSKGGVSLAPSVVDSRPGRVSGGRYGAWKIPSGSGISFRIQKIQDPDASGYSQDTGF